MRHRLIIINTRFRIRHLLIRQRSFPSDLLPPLTLTINNPSNNVSSPSPSPSSLILETNYRFNFQTYFFSASFDIVWSGPMFFQHWSTTNEREVKKLVRSDSRINMVQLLPPRIHGTSAGFPASLVHPNLPARLFNSLSLELFAQSS